MIFPLVFHLVFTGAKSKMRVEEKKRGWNDMMKNEMKVQDTAFLSSSVSEASREFFSCFFLIILTCMNPSGQPGRSEPELDMRLPSVVSKSLSALPSSNRPTVKPSKMI